LARNSRTPDGLLRSRRLTEIDDALFTKAEIKEHQASVAGLRDNLVHKSAAAKKKSAVEVSRDVKKFVTTYSEKLLAAGVALASNDLA
jgi:hypothetical protein